MRQIRLQWHARKPQTYGSETLVPVPSQTRKKPQGDATFFSSGGKGYLADTMTVKSLSVMLCPMPQSLRSFFVPIGKVKGASGTGKNRPIIRLCSTNDNIRAFFLAAQLNITLVLVDTNSMHPKDISHTG
eukprot:scaffold24800_cov117-Cylindrotheca_fusiformis.AAC.1